MKNMISRKIFHYEPKSLDNCFLPQTIIFRIKCLENKFLASKVRKKAEKIKNII